MGAYLLKTKSKKSLKGTKEKTDIANSRKLGGSWRMKMWKTGHPGSGQRGSLGEGNDGLGKKMKRKRIYRALL